MTDKDFEFITDKIGIWFANLKLKSFRHTFDGDTYPSSALVTDYELFIAKLKKDIEFIPEGPVSEDSDNAARDYADACGYDNDTHFMARQLCVEHFKAGAKWDRKKIIDKACDYIASLRRLDDDVVYDFRKAMEG